MKTSLRGLFAAGLLFTIPALADSQWVTDYAKALDQAKADNKAVLLDFTGSDWCPWCMKMKDEALDTRQFKDFAGKSLVLVEVDFPHKKPQSDELKAQNQQLARKFQVNGFPDFIIVSKHGTLLGRIDGYEPGGPSAFIASIKKFYRPPSASAGADAGAQDDFDSFFKKPAASASQ